MNWPAIVQAMVAAGFSPGEAVVIAGLVVVIVQHEVTLGRLKVRSEQASADRARLWKEQRDMKIAAALAMFTHERDHHGLTAEEPQSD